MTGSGDSQPTDWMSKSAEADTGGNSTSSPLWRARSSAAASAARQSFRRFEAAAEQARRLRIESRNTRPGFDHQNAARQAPQNSAQAFADAVVFFQTRGQVAVRDFKFLAQMGHLPLQLSIGTLERTCRLCE